MDPRTVQERRGQVQLVDVREPDEWAVGYIEGSTHIPLGVLPVRLGELDPAVPVVTVCRSGGRAAQAAELLTERGLSASVLDGGITRWQSERLPLVTPDTRPDPA
ncbi:MAG: rhodanese-like domain-containing protein [Actinomycetota bacterium]|nr:rhodanese-like domain-containing protein [Actinomycetota bacterium]